MTTPSVSAKTSSVERENKKLRKELLAAQKRIAELHEQLATQQTLPKNTTTTTKTTQSNTELLQEFRRCRKYFDSTNDALYVFRPNIDNTHIGKIIDANTTALQRLGYSLDELRSIPSKNIELNNLEQKVQKILTSFHQDRAITFETQHITKTGQIIPLEVHAQPIEVANEKLVFVRAEDITERKQAEQEIHKREHLYRLLADNVQDVIWTTDINLKPIFISPSIAKLSGYKPDEAIALIYRSIILESPLFENFQKTTHKTEIKPLCWEGELLRKDSNIIWVESIASPLWDDTDHFIGIIGVTRDITSRKEMISELKSAKEQATMANKAKSVFLANMSHEIRTPLNGILGTLQLLGLTPLSSEQNKYIETAKISGNNLLNIINDVLDFSKIEAGKITIKKEVFSPRELIHSVVSSLEAVVADRDIQFTVTIGQDVPEQLTADQGRLHQIFSNIIGNAVKFTERGEINIEMHYLTNKEHTVPRLKCVISDTGIGIPDKHNQQLFTPFFQIERSYRKRYKGTGLGLSIVKQLVTLMGGTIHLENRPHGGTKVTFDIKTERARTDDHPASIQQTPEPQRATHHTFSLLVVEDEPINQEILKSLLEKFGHQVTLANNGKEALDILAKKSSFDCILMDIQMPEMDGLETTAIIRSEQRFKAVVNIPIIALTAFAMKEDKENFLAAGMNDYLSKPVTIEKLIEKLDTLLPA